MRGTMTLVATAALWLLGSPQSTMFGYQDDTKLLTTETYLEMESVGSPAISPPGNDNTLVAQSLFRYNLLRVWISSASTIRTAISQGRFTARPDCPSAAATHC